MEDIKKELHKLQFDYYEHGSRMDTIVPDSDIKNILELIEQKIKEAKISENERWYKEMQGRFAMGIMPLIHEMDFIDRIKELREIK